MVISSSALVAPSATTEIRAGIDPKLAGPVDPRLIEHQDHPASAGDSRPGEAAVPARCGFSSSQSYSP
jgi:hypothetical protein